MATETNDTAGSDARVIGALVLLALVIRVGAAFRTATIFNDGPTFVKLAEAAIHGDWLVTLSHHYHPLYPVLIAAVSPLVGELELAGVCVSVLAGSFAVVPIYVFLRRSFDSHIAWVGGVLLALQPYAAIFSADVQSEGLYLALFLAALTLTWRAIQEGTTALAAAAGALAGLAYLVRPEGLGVAAVGGGFAVLRLIQGRWDVATASRWGASMLLCAGLVAGPYVLHLHELTGEWMLTQKKSVSELMKREDPTESRSSTIREHELRRTPESLPRPRAAMLVPSALVEAAARLPSERPGASGPLPSGIQSEPRALSAAFKLVVVSVSAFHPLLVVLLAIGLYTERGRPSDRGLFLAGLISVYAVVLYGLVLNVGYLDRRHVLPPLLPLLGYAAVGAPIVGRALLRLLRRRAHEQRRAAVWIALALVLAITLPKTWSRHREDHLATRGAAEWLATREDLTGAVAAQKLRTAYYAGEAFIPTGPERSSLDVASLRRLGARFLIVDDQQLRKLPGIRDDIGGELRELHRTRAGARTAFVYEVTDPSQGSR